MIEEAGKTRPRISESLMELEAPILEIQSNNGCRPRKEVFKKKTRRTKEVEEGRVVDFGGGKEGHVSETACRNGNGGGALTRSAY